MNHSTALPFDALIVVENYVWDGVPQTKNQSHHYFPAAWGAMTDQPVLIVNTIYPRQVMSHPSTGWHFRPGLRRAQSKNVYVLNIWQDDWRESAYLGRTLPVSKTAQKIQQAANTLQITAPVLMLSEPAHGALCGQCGERFSVWYCSDDFAASDTRRAQSIRQNEERYMSDVDLIMAVSPTLEESWRPRARRVLLLPSAVDAVEMAEFAVQETGIVGWPSDGVAHPCVVYLGSFNERVDYTCLTAAVRQCPATTFLFIGPIATDASSSSYANALADIQASPNTVFLGRRNRREIAWILSQCDIGIIPYLDNDFNRSCSPVKAYEYSALGLPTVATPLPAMQLVKEHVYLADASHFTQAVHEVLDNLVPWRAHAQALLAANTWQDRVRTVQQTLVTIGREG